MNVEDLHSWNMKPEPIDGCEIQCYECGEWSNHIEWKEVCAYCEDCGEHAAIKCPKCDFIFDHVYSLEFKTRINQHTN